MPTVLYGAQFRPDSKPKETEMPRKAEFDIGDVVWLVSGGPRMSVTGAVEGGGGAQILIHAEWFDKNHELRTADFKPSVLRKTSEPDWAALRQREDAR
jgi:uncharacterized protein YodC (DUF2158 family)